MIDWRPIETAPTCAGSEGKQFLGWHRAGFAAILAWVLLDGGPTLMDSNGDVDLEWFTHWAPLTPPEEK